MFKLVANPTFKHRVTAQVPIDGGHDEQAFYVTYRVLTTDRVGQFALHTNEGTTEFLNAVVASCDDITDEAGNKIEWSDSVRDEVFRMPYARAAISAGYFDAINKARKGN